MPPY